MTVTGAGRVRGSASRHNVCHSLHPSSRIDSNSSLGTSRTKFDSTSTDADRTSFTGRDLRRVVEPGEVRLFVGTSSEDLPCSAAVRLTGPRGSSPPTGCW